MSFITWIREAIFGPNGTDIVAQDKEVEEIKREYNDHLEETRSNFRTTQGRFRDMRITKDGS